MVPCFHHVYIIPCPTFCDHASQLRLEIASTHQAAYIVIPIHRFIQTDRQAYTWIDCKPVSFLEMKFRKCAEGFLLAHFPPSRLMNSEIHKEHHTFTKQFIACNAFIFTIAAACTAPWLVAL